MPLMLMGAFIFCSFSEVTRPCTFTLYTLVRLALGFSRRVLRVLSLVTRSKP